MAQYQGGAMVLSPEIVTVTFADDMNESAAGGREHFAEASQCLRR
jgi:hypothetical protein